VSGAPAVHGWRPRQVWRAAACLAVALASATRAAAAAPPSRPDLVLIVVESLRADFTGCYGCPMPTTPVIDALASNGTRFAHAVASSSWTQPSIATLFSSLLPERHGMNRHRQTIRGEAVMLASHLAAAGYQTVGIVANPMLHRCYGFARGFELFDDYTIAQAPGGLGDAGANAATQRASGATVTRLAVSWLKRRDPARPLFLFLFYMDPHFDYLPPPPFDRLFTDDPVPAPRGIESLGAAFVAPAVRERIRAAYAGEIRYTDTCIGTFLDALQSTPRGAGTAIVLCGDHGEAFWEHGRMMHGHHLYDEQIRVPLVIRAPGSTPGAVIAGQAGLIDLAPTLASLAGLAPPAGGAWEGLDLSSWLKGGTLPDRPLLLDTRIGGHLRAVRTPALKIIGRPPFEAPAEIYDLAADPAETNNLAGASPLPAGAGRLLSLLRPSSEAPSSKPVNIDPATLRQIKSLGYAH